MSVGCQGCLGPAKVTTNEDARVLDTTLPMLGFHDFMRPMKTKAALTLHLRSVLGLSRLERCTQACQAGINGPVPMSGTVILSSLHWLSRN